MATPTESEFKLRATQPIETAAVDAALREFGARCRRAATREHVDTYLDDDRGSLLAAGIGLRVREHGDDRRVTFKGPRLPDGGAANLMVREELELAWPESALPAHADDLPAPLRRKIRKRTGGRALVPHLELHVRREVRVLAESGGEVDRCELAIDRVEARANGRTATFDEVELEVLDDVAWSERLAHELRTRLPVGFATVDKPRHAAALLGVERRRSMDPEDLAMEPTGRAVTRALRTQLDRMRRRERGLLAGDDPEDVHQMRVATRRMRSAIRAFRELWPEATADRMLGHLGEAGRRLGEVRDLDVMLGRLPDELAALPPQLAPAGDRIVAWFEQRRRRARAALLDWLRSDARRDELERFARDVDAVEGELARDPFHHTASPRLGRAARQLRKLTRALPDELPIEPAHRVRLAAKRVRYLADLCADVPDLFDPRARRAVVRVQQRLGDLCDHEIAVERLLAQVHAAVAGPDGAWTAAAFGALAARHGSAAVAARRAAADALERLDRKKVWKGFPRPGKA